MTDFVIRVIKGRGNNRVTESSGKITRCNCCTCTFSQTLYLIPLRIICSLKASETAESNPSCLPDFFFASWIKTSRCLESVRISARISLRSARRLSISFCRSARESFFKSSGKSSPFTSDNLTLSFSIDCSRSPE